MAHYTIMGVIVYIDNELRNLPKLLARPAKSFIHLTPEEEAHLIEIIARHARYHFSNEITRGWLNSENELRAMSVEELTTCFSRASALAEVLKNIEIDLMRGLQSARCEEERLQIERRLASNSSSTVQAYKQGLQALCLLLSKGQTVHMFCDLPPLNLTFYPPHLFNL